MPNALSSTYPGTQATSTLGLHSTDFFATPNATAFARHINERLSWGFGIFVTQVDSQSATAESQFSGVTSLTASPSNAQYQQRIDSQQASALYHIGPGIGWQVLPSVRIGASLFATYGKQSYFFQYLQSVQSDDGTAVYYDMLEQRGSSSYIGAQTQVGVQWDVTDDWHAGFVVRSPEFVLKSSQNEADVSAMASDTPRSYQMPSFELDEYTYCCFAVDPSCVQDTSVTGCNGASTGYSCTGSVPPDSTDLTLECSVGVPDPTSGSTTDYCCLTGDTFVSGTCEADAAVADCAGGSYGFSCVGTNTPDQTDPTLVCSDGAPDGSNTDFCCLVMQDSSSSCAPDASVTSRCTAPGSFGFKWTSAMDDPMALDPSLTCEPGVVDADGASEDFCCTN